MKSSLRRVSEIPKFFWMITASISVAMVLVSVSMFLYVQSGAAQLDLSRPDYQAVRKHAQKTDSFEGFDTHASLSAESIAQFEKLFDQKLHEVDAYKDSFHSAAISDTELEIKAE